jgi:hypothetical protein
MAIVAPNEKTTMNFRDMTTPELIAYIRRAASAWFNDRQMRALEELIRRHELTQKRTLVLVRQQDD